MPDRGTQSLGREFERRSEKNPSRGPGGFLNMFSVSICGCSTGSELWFDMHLVDIFSR
jgi:hypothetical protein